MQSFCNRDGVFKRFGQPNQVAFLNDTEEWTYNGDEISDTGRLPATDTVNGSLPKTVPYQKYIRFLFNKDGEVTGYQTQGFDLSLVRKRKWWVDTLKYTAVGIADIILLEIAFNKLFAHLGP